MPRDLSWESALPEHEDGGYIFVPLISSEALREEGENMGHCVAHYDDDCANGKSRIFSVRSTLSQERLATVELHIDDLLLKEKWFVGQVRGFNNAKCAKLLLSAADKLALRYSIKLAGD